MGQYYKLVNITKKEVVHPHHIVGGAKYLEWLFNYQVCVLGWLLRQSNEGGGGDVPFEKSEAYADICNMLLTEFSEFVDEDGHCRDCKL